jgi:5-methylcytosine-specific restriction endonuclease McrA
MAGNKIAMIWAKSDGHCWYCGVDFRGGSSSYPHLEHQMPRSLGGGSEIENIFLSCSLCNGRKGTLTLEEYRERAAINAVGLNKLSQNQLSWLLERGVDVMKMIRDELGPRYPIVFYGESIHHE